MGTPTSIGSVRIASIVAVISIVAVACAGASSGTPAAEGGGSSQGPAAGNPAGGTASAAAGAGSGAAASPAGGAASPAGGGTSGGAVAAGGDLCALLGPGDFSTAGVSGAGAPTKNGDQASAYCVYKGVSAAGGGIELDVFVLPSAAEAVTNFGDTGMYALDAATAAAIGADKVGFYPDQLGNDPGTTFDELRALKGRLWFVLGIPSNPSSKDQLLALAKLVVARSASSS